MPTIDWRTDFENATDPDCVLLTKYGDIISGRWNGKTFCWWVHGGGSLYKDQLVGWMPRASLPAPPVGGASRKPATSKELDRRRGADEAEELSNAEIEDLVTELAAKLDREGAEKLIERLRGKDAVRDAHYLLPTAADEIERLHGGCDEVVAKIKSIVDGKHITEDGLYWRGMNMMP